MDAVAAEKTNPERCPRQQARPPCARTSSECRPVVHPEPCEARSRAIFGRPYRPASRKFRSRPARAPHPQIPPPSAEARAISDGSSISSIELTPNHRQPWVYARIALRICACSVLAGKEVRRAKPPAEKLIQRNIEVRHAIDIEPVVLDIFHDCCSTGFGPKRNRIRSRRPTGS